MFDFFKKRHEILGMNARNLHYIRPFNKRRARKIADDKLISKRVLRKHNLPVPKLIGKIDSYQALESFDWSSLPESFVLKPTKGFGGGGILVVFARKKNQVDTWIKADGSVITKDDLETHIRNIFEGSFSLSNTPDIAFFEERLRIHKTLKPYSFKGIPDIRIIVFNKVPVMAMLRLPTKESGGKANLQLGGIGVGIDLASGITTSAVYGKSGRIIEYLPGTRLLLSGIKLPYWKDILRMAVEAQIVSGLGYLGADIALDRERGPIFLELNARPGLSIQIANLAGLKERLERVKGLKIKTPERGVRVGMNLFGGEIDEEVEGISGKKIIGSIEKITLLGKGGEEMTVEAKIDTGAASTSIDRTLAMKLGFGELIAFFDTIQQPPTNNRSDAKSIEAALRKQYLGTHPDLENIMLVYSASGSSIRPVVKVSFVMNRVHIVAKVNITDRASLTYPVIIGKRDLKPFLINIS